MTYTDTYKSKQFDPSAPPWQQTYH